MCAPDRAQKRRPSWGVKNAFQGGARAPGRAYEGAWRPFTRRHLEERQEPRLEPQEQEQEQAWPE